MKSGGSGPLEIGIDCVDIPRFEQDIASKKKILKKIFTENEVQYCEKKMKAGQHYAVRFAAKEAIIKAFACYGIEISLSSIEILNKENRIPYVNILDDKLKEYEIKISLSHAENNAVACAIVSKSSKTQ
jgi:holo-[acyl-carrier protein] synthase